MMKVMISSCDVKTQRVFSWVFIIWFTSAVGIAVGQGQELIHRSARCGENVTLPCQAALAFKTSWVFKNETVCQWSNAQPDPEADRCLVLPLRNVMPDDSGTYLCKTYSPSGPKSEKTVLTVEDCHESSDSFIVDKHAKCWFSGVFPRGTVHWSEGDVNLTDHADTKEVKDQLGLYNVSSTIDVRRGNESQSYNCSLWIPSTGKYLSHRQVPAVGRVESAGSEVRLQWICIMVEIIVLKLLR